MDKIDSFIIYAKEKGGDQIEFTFVLLEDDIDEIYSEIIIDYIDSLTRSLNQKYPQYKFTWQEAHRIIPKNLTEEVIWQHMIQSRSN